MEYGFREKLVIFLFKLTFHEREFFLNVNLKKGEKNMEKYKNFFRMLSLGYVSVSLDFILWTAVIVGMAFGADTSIIGVVGLIVILCLNLYLASKIKDRKYKIFIAAICNTVMLSIIFCLVISTQVVLNSFILKK